MFKAYSGAINTNLTDKWQDGWIISLKRPFCVTGVNSKTVGDAEMIQRQTCKLTCSHDLGSMYSDCVSFGTFVQTDLYIIFRYLSQIHWGLYKVLEQLFINVLLLLQLSISKGNFLTTNTY